MKEISFEEYYRQVEQLVLDFGYRQGYAKIFLMDIQICYDEGKTVEQCFDIVF